MDNKEELNDVLDDLAPFIRAGFRPDNHTLEDDVCFRKMLLENGIPLFAGIFIHLKLMMHRFTAEWEGKDDPCEVFHAGRHYGALASLYRDDAPYHMLWMFMDNLMNLDLLKIPLSDPVASTYVRNIQGDFEYNRKDHEYRQAFEANSYMLTRVSNQMILRDAHVMELNSTSAKWKNRFPDDTVPVYYSILITEREAMLRQAFMEQEVLPETIDERIGSDERIIILKKKYEAACLMAFDTASFGYQHLNFNGRDIREIIREEVTYSQVDRISEMKKFNALRREILRLSHPDSPEFRKSPPQIQKFKSGIFRKLSGLDPSDPDYRRIIEDAWVNYSLMMSAIDSGHTLSAPEKLMLLRESCRGLERTLSGLMEECGTISAKIESLKTEILSGNAIYAKLAEVYSEIPYKN